MKIGVIGLGNAGRRHLVNLHKILGVTASADIVGCDHRFCEEMLEVDINFTQVNTVELLWEWGPDAVVIATPPELHFIQALEAMERGVKKVFVEKPLCETAERAEFLERYARQHNVHLQCGYQLRYCQSIQQTQEDLVRHTHLWFRAVLSSAMSAWPNATYTRQLLAEFSHELDLLRLFSPWDRHGDLTVLAKPHEIGVTVYVDGDRVSGELLLQNPDQPQANGALRQWHFTGPTDHLWTFDAEENTHAYEDELQAFLDGDTKHSTTGVQAVYLMAAVQRSLDEKRWVAL